MRGLKSLRKAEFRCKEQWLGKVRKRKGERRKLQGNKIDAQKRDVRVGQDGAESYLKVNK